MKRGKKWSLEAEKLLIKLWGEHLEALRGDRKKKRYIYEALAEQLKAYGYKLNGVQVKRKIHNLVNRYRAENKKIGSTNGTTSDWSLFEYIHQIIGNSKALNLAQTSEESSDYREVFSHFSTLLESSEDTSSSCEPIRKRKKNSFEEDVLEELRRGNETAKIARQALADIGERSKKIQEQLIAVGREQNRMLRQFIEQSKNFQTQFLSLLKEKN